MAVVSDILYKVQIRSVKGNLETEVTNLQIDSRLATKGTCFIAIKGTATDGHQYIAKAIENGAEVIIANHWPVEELKDDITFITVEETSVAAGLIAANFYKNPSETMKVVGVTGTNGKTTIATLLFKLFSGLGYTCGLISTVQNQIGDEVLSATHTTPDPVSLQGLLANMKTKGCSHVFMECSSHAIHQHRINGIQFTGALFSNITHDHLDYHKTFDAYINAKKAFFDHLPSTAFAISNADDKRGTVMLQNTSAKKYYYSLRTVADIKGKIIDNALSGLQMMVQDQEVHFRLIGEFNAYNLLAVYGAAICLGEDKFEVLQVLSNLTGAEGRFDYAVSVNQRVIGIIDYAHTPDALLNVLQTIKKLQKGNERVITVVGCGGDRDKTKRPIMAEVACEWSDKVIFTSDNPRTEDPIAILNDMEAGLKPSVKRKYLVIEDRKEAIKNAITLAEENDIVLIAGKGHEKYQDIKGVKHPFDDMQVLQQTFELLDK